MAVFELEHPLGQDLEALQGGLFIGFEDLRKKLPDEIAINYEDAMTSGVGVSTLRIANWATKNQAVLYYPLAVEETDTNWLVGDKDDPEPAHVRHRIHVRDMLGRGFNFKLLGQDENYALTPYMQFDVIDDGIVTSAQIDGEVVQYFGQFESGGYDTLAVAARQLVDLDILKKLVA
ncbi:MAG: hypothetical protein M3Q36_01850 [bacterium]|nr:hypothetical protein [bacterium]